MAIVLQCVHADGVNLESVQEQHKCLPLAASHGAVVIGRSHQPQMFDCLVPDEAKRVTISRSHFELFWEGSALWLKKLSANPMVIDRKKLTEGKMEINQGSHIGFAGGPQGPNVPFLVFGVQLGPSSGHRTLPPPGTQTPPQPPPPGAQMLPQSQAMCRSRTPPPPGARTPPQPLAPSGYPTHPQPGGQTPPQSASSMAVPAGYPTHPQPGRQTPPQSASSMAVPAGYPASPQPGAQTPPQSTSSMAVPMGSPHGPRLPIASAGNPNATEIAAGAGHPKAAVISPKAVGKVAPYVLSCVNARGKDTTSLPPEARRIGIFPDLPLTMGRQHQPGFFEGLLGNDPSLLQFVSRSHLFIDAKRNMQPMAFEVTNLGMNPVFLSNNASDGVNGQRLNKGEKGMVNIRGTVSFAAQKSSQAQDIHFFLILRLEEDIPPLMLAPRPKAATPPEPQVSGACTPGSAPVSPACAALAPGSPASADGGLGQDVHHWDPASGQMPLVRGEPVNASPVAQSPAHVPPQSFAGLDDFYVNSQAMDGNEPVQSVASQLQHFFDPAASQNHVAQSASSIAAAQGASPSNAAQDQPLHLLSAPFMLELSGSAIHDHFPLERRRVPGRPEGLVIGRMHQQQLHGEALVEGTMQFISRDHFRIEPSENGCWRILALSQNPMWRLQAGSLTVVSREHPLPLASGDEIMLFTGAQPVAPHGPGSQGTLTWLFLQSLPQANVSQTPVGTSGSIGTVIMQRPSVMKRPDDSHAPGHHGNSAVMQTSVSVDSPLPSCAEVLTPRFQYSIDYQVSAEHRAGVVEQMPAPPTTNSDPHVVQMPATHPGNPEPLANDFFVPSHLAGKAVNMPQSSSSYTPRGAGAGAPSTKAAGPMVVPVSVLSVPHPIAQGADENADKRKPPVDMSFGNSEMNDRFASSGFSYDQ